MAVGGRTTNTFPEILTEILRDLAIAQTLPDTDLEFLSTINSMITAKLREPIDAATSSMPPGQGPTAGALGPSVGGPPGGPPLMAPPGGPPPMPGPPPGLPPMGPPPMPPGAAGPPPGLRNPGPSPDELSRLLG